MLALIRNCQLMASVQYATFAFNLI